MLLLFIIFSPVRKGRIEDLHNLLWLISHFGCQSAVGFVGSGGQLWAGRMPTGTSPSWAELGRHFQARGLSGVSWDNCNEICSHIFSRWTQNELLQFFCSLVLAIFFADSQCQYRFSCNVLCKHKITVSQKSGCESRVIPSLKYHYPRVLAISSCFLIILGSDGSKAHFPLHGSLTELSVKQAD